MQNGKKVKFVTSIVSLKPYNFDKILTIPNALHFI